MRTSGSLLARTSVLLVLLFAAVPEAYALCGTTTANTGGITATGAQTLTCDTTLTATGSGGFIDFTSTVDGGFALSTNTVGATTFAGAVGGVTPLASLNVTTNTFSANAQMNIGSGGLALTTSGGPITQISAFTIGGTSNFNAGANAITLTNTSNDFTGAVTANGAGVAITDTNSLDIAGLTDNANGNVNLIAGGTLTLNAGLSGGNVSLTDTNGLTLNNDVTANGTLSLTTTNAAITQTAGVLTVTGASTVDAGSGAIMLNDLNSFGGTMSATGSSVSITNQSNLNVGTITSTSALALNASAVSVSGTLTFGNGSTAGNVSGNYTQNGTLALHASASGNDQLAVSGNTTLGGTLSVAFSSAPTVGQNFTVLTATGSVAGTFATVNVTGLSPGQVAAVTYNASSVVLTINAITPVTLQSFEVD